MTVQTVQITDQSNLKIVVQSPGHTLMSSQHSRILLLDLADRLTVTELIVESDIRTGQIFSEQFRSHLVVFAGRLYEMQQCVGPHQIARTFVTGKTVLKTSHVRLSQTDGRGLHGIPLGFFHQKRSASYFFVRIFEALGYFTAAGVCLCFKRLNFEI